MIEDLELEAMCKAAWAERVRDSERSGFKLPPWEQTEAPANDPFAFALAEVYDELRQEMRAARNAFYDFQKARVHLTKSIT